MEKRKLGGTGLEVGVIGLGAEHLVASRENVEAIFEAALPAGLNYVDLIYNDPLQAHADQWAAIGPAVRRHRSQLVLTLHYGFIEHEPLPHCDACFTAALKQLGNGFADIAMLTMIDSESLWQGWAQEAIARLREYQRDERLGFIGVSLHEPEVGRTVVESGLVDVLMYPVNLYQHHDNQAAAELLRTCARHQVGVVAMKPYYGGRLLTTDGRLTGITPAQCLHYVLSQPVATTVPGARDVDEMLQALGYLVARSEEKEFTALEDDLAYRLHGQCVSCRHCLPCPQGISIPDVMECLAYVQYYGLTPYHQQSNRQWYHSLPAKASDCIECQVCLERCPFQVDIIGKMRRALELFETS